MLPEPEKQISGPNAIRAALAKLDLDQLEKQAREDLASGKRTKKNSAVKMLNVISGLRRNNLTPADLTITKVPVIPPIFRPFSVSGNTFLPGDANELYKDLINYNNTYKELKDEVGEEASADAAYQLYQATKSLYGYSDPVNPKTRQRGVSGFLQHLIGKGAGPKFCYDSETEILTRDGWVKFPDLKEGVEVGTVNPATLQFEWQTPTAYVHEEYSGDMVYFTPDRQIDLLVTPNHRMFFRKFTDGFVPGNWEIETAAKFVGDTQSTVWLTKPFDFNLETQEELEQVQEWLGADGKFVHVTRSGEQAFIVDNYKGTIHCCSVPNTLLVVRRNGKTVVSGNSMFQRRLFSKNMDSVGRGVITANPELDMDEVGIPEEIAWKIYGPYIQRKLVQSGMSAMRALENVTNRSDFAKKALDREMGERPVVYSRAPAWHKYNVIAGWPRTVKGDNIELNPYVSSGLGADHNGDHQVGRILVLLDKKYINKNQHLCLTYPLPDSMVLDMVTKNIIPLVNVEEQSLFLTDLSEFPVTELQKVKGDGVNGPIGFYEVPKGTKVVSYDPETNKPVWKDVAFYSVHPQREIEVVSLSNNRQIITDDHPRAIYGIAPSDDTMSMKHYTPTEALKLGVMVPVVSNMEEVTRELESVYTIPIADKTVKLDWNFGYLLGAICGDGWWDKKTYKNGRHIYLADLHGYVATRVHTVLSSIFGRVSWSKFAQYKKDDASRYGDSVKHTFGFADAEVFAEFLTQWLKGGATENSAGSASKTLPDFFMLAPIEFRKGLLNGIIDTDGTCCVSNGKSKPQLQISMTSTSMRLVCDVKYLCLTLGVGANVSFSKMTGRNNVAWICSISTPSAKALGLFNNLASDYKRTAFIETEVTMAGSFTVNNKVPVSDRIFDLIQKDIYSPKIRPHERSEVSPEMEWKKLSQNICAQWSKVGQTKLATRATVESTRNYFLQMHAKNQRVVAEAIRDLRSGETRVSQVRTELWRKAIAIIAPKQDTSERYKEGQLVATRINRPTKEGVISSKVSNYLADWLETFPRYRAFVFSSEFSAWWYKFVEPKVINWAQVIDVEKTGQKEDGYDLTVPGFETFMSADGIILSNTMNVHLPSFPESVEEAKEKLMPSKMVYSIKQEDTIVPALKHEQILGLYTAATRPSKNKHVFATEDEAKAAIQSGAVKLSDEVEIVPPSQMSAQMG